MSFKQHSAKKYIFILTLFSFLLLSFSLVSACSLSTECNDNNICTSDICQSGICYNIPINGCSGGCQSSTECNDYNTCTSDICQSGICYNININGCSLENSYNFSYIRNESNPIFNNSHGGGEAQSIYENGVVHQWFRNGDRTIGDLVMYWNTTNGNTWTEPVNLTGVDGILEVSVIKVGSLYYLFGVSSTLDAYYEKKIYVFSSPNKIDWTANCSGNPIISPDGVSAQNNDVWYNVTSGMWNMVLQEGTYPPYYLNYWNSSDLCSGWTDEGTIIANGDAPRLIYMNGYFILYYDDDNTQILVSKGNTLTNLTFLGTALTGYSEENPLTDVDLAIISDNNPSFSHKFYMYYVQAQGRSGVAYDYYNRTFAIVHSINAVFTCSSSSECNDYNTCTSDICQSGICYNININNCSNGCSLSTECNDNNICTSDICQSGACYNIPIVNGECSTTTEAQSLFDGIATYFDNLFPSPTGMTTGHKLSFVLITFLLVDLVIFLIFFFGIKNPKGSVWAILVIDVLLYFYFLASGYIPVSIFIFCILLLITIAFLKFKGGN
jgi:hypothetical protein